MTINEFVNLWNGLDVSFPNCANNECMALMHRYISEVLKIEDPLVLAQPTAAQVWTNFPNVIGHQYFNQVANTLTGIPPAGALMIFKPTPGDLAGHICVVLEGATVNSFHSFDANFPWGSKPHIQEHPYTDAQGNDIVYGWLIPNGNLVTQDAVSVADPQQIQKLNDAVNSCQTQLKTALDQVSSAQNQLTKEQDMVKSLQDDKKSLTDEVTRLQTQLKAEQEEIITLNDTIEKQASSNKNYGQETLDLTHANSDLTDYLFATADKLGITRNNKKVADIEEEILTKLNSIDLLLKAAGVASGLLHQMAQTLQLDDPKANDKEVANKIITYVKGLQGMLQSLKPTNQQDINPANEQITKPSIMSRFIAWWWQPKGGGV